MKILNALPWVVLLIVFALILFRRRRRSYRSERARILDLLKRGHVVHFLDNSHTEPARGLREIEKSIGKHGFTENELGVSMSDLIEHAVTCQRMSLVCLEKYLKECRARQVRIEASETMLDGWATAMSNAFIPDFVNTKARIDAERRNLRKITLRWRHSLDADQRPAAQQFDTSEPQKQ